jgi:hypothetical protein
LFNSGNYCKTSIKTSKYKNDGLPKSAQTMRRNQK